MQLRLHLIIAVCCVFATPAWARDIYVDNTAGDDQNNGNVAGAAGGRLGPYRTITRALKATHKGDRVILVNTGEVYRESITLQGGRQSGVPGAPFELIGNGAILDGTTAVPAAGWSYYDGNVFRYKPPKKSFSLLYLDGKPAQRHKVLERGGIAKLEPRQWSLFEGALYFCVEEGHLPQTYDLAFTGLQVGITLYEVHDVVVRDLVVQGFRLDGVNAHDGVHGATLNGLTCRGNGRSGVSIGGASRVRMEACLVGNNGAAQVRVEGACHAELVGCDLLDNTAPKIVRDGGKIVVND